MSTLTLAADLLKFYTLDQNNNVITLNGINVSNLNRLHAPVRKTTMGDYSISTVFVGQDLEPNNPNGPMVFETMVFAGNGDTVYCKRGTEWNEAVRNHQDAVDYATYQLEAVRIVEACDLSEGF